MNLIYKYIEKYGGLTEGNELYLRKYFPWSKAKKIVYNNRTPYEKIYESYEKTGYFNVPLRIQNEFKLMFNIMDLTDEELEALRCERYNTLNCKMDNDIEMELEGVFVSNMEGYEFGNSVIITTIIAADYHYKI